jgi:hypothetical protein
MISSRRKPKKVGEKKSAPIPLHLGLNPELRGGKSNCREKGSAPSVSHKMR